MTPILSVVTIFIISKVIVSIVVGSKSNWAKFLKDLRQTSYHTLYCRIVVS
jgi:hypothetical protein